MCSRPHGLRRGPDAHLGNAVGQCDVLGDVRLITCIFMVGLEDVVIDNWMLDLTGQTQDIITVIVAVVIVAIAVHFR